MLREGALWQTGKHILMFDEGKSIHMLQILTNEKIAVESKSRGLQFYTFWGISMGIKRRLIDIAKKITFYFLQNV
jgi:hypothetical protein